MVLYSAGVGWWRGGEGCQRDEVGIYSNIESAATPSGAAATHCLCYNQLKIIKKKKGTHMGVHVSAKAVGVCLSSFLKPDITCL